MYDSRCAGACSTALLASVTWLGVNWDSWVQESWSGMDADMPLSQGLVCCGSCYLILDQQVKKWRRQRAVGCLKMSLLVKWEENISPIKLICRQAISFPCLQEYVDNKRQTDCIKGHRRTTVALIFCCSDFNWPTENDFFVSSLYKSSFAEWTLSGCRLQDKITIWFSFPIQFKNHYCYLIMSCWILVPKSMSYCSLVSNLLSYCSWIQSIQ